MKRTEFAAGAGRLSCLLAVAAATIVPFGCGPTGPGMAQVTGKVTYKGQPVPKGTITFVSSAQAGRNATGQLDASGNYRLQTENPGDDALIGDYKVTIYAHDEPVLQYIPKTPVEAKILTPTKYENANTTDLKASVKGGSNAIDFPLTD